MSNPSDKFQYIQYLNIRKAFLQPEYRGLESDEVELKYEEFSKLLLSQKYILLKCKYPQNFRRDDYKGRIAFVVLTRYDSEFRNRSKELSMLMDKLSSMPEIKNNIQISDLFLITLQYLKKRALKKMKEYKQFAHTNILNVKFSSEMPKANLCNIHKICTKEEIKNLVEESYTMIDTQSCISENDTQNVWIGGFSGELIKIIKPSSMAGLSIVYRYVTGVINRIKIDEKVDDEDDEKAENEDDEKADEKTDE